MKFNILALFVCVLLAVALVAALPADESLPGDLARDTDHTYNGYEPQSFFKLKKLKKLLLG